MVHSAIWRFILQRYRASILTVPRVEIGLSDDGFVRIRFCGWWLNISSTASLREAHGGGETRSVQSTT